MEITIETERLLLRQFARADAEALCAVCNQDYILKWMPDWKGTVEQKRAWIQWVEGKYTGRDKDNLRIMLAVTLKEKKRFIGMVGIGNKPEVENEIEVAYFVSLRHANRGYITEAVNAMSSWAFQTLNPDYLIAIVEPENVPSLRIVEKCGFKELGTKMILNSGESGEKPFYYFRLYHPAKRSHC